VQDITYIPTGEGWLYLASVIDLGSRRLLGYSMADHMRTELVLDALTMAVAARGGDHAAAGVIGHADRGSQAGQYTSNDYLEFLHARQMRRQALNPSADVSSSRCIGAPSDRWARVTGWSRHMTVTPGQCSVTLA
jgi:transposase InsO family protein